MSHLTLSRCWTRIAALVAVLSLTPLALPGGSGSRAFDENQACAAGTGTTTKCVLEVDSICTRDGQILYDAYTSGL